MRLQLSICNRFTTMVRPRCIVCKKTVTVRQHALLCENCDEWQHRLCDTGKHYLFYFTNFLILLYWDVQLDVLEGVKCVFRLNQYIQICNDIRLQFDSFDNSDFSSECYSIFPFLWAIFMICSTKFIIPINLNYLINYKTCLSINSNTNGVIHNILDCFPQIIFAQNEII